MESKVEAETDEADARPAALVSIVFMFGALPPVLLTDEVVAVERPNTFADSSFAFGSPLSIQKYTRKFDETENKLLTFYRGAVKLSAKWSEQISY